jgi:hypothetical protein
VVGAGATTTSIPSNANKAANYYGVPTGQSTPGAIVFTSGALAGTRVTVSANTAGPNSTLTVSTLPSAPASGDTFTAYPDYVAAAADSLHPSSTSASVPYGGHYILRDQAAAKYSAW